VHVTAEARTGEGGQLALDLTCVAHGGRLFRIMGATRPSALRDFAETFRMTARSFRTPTPAERAGIRETRLRLARGQAGETVAGLAARTRSVKPEMVAVANALDVSTRLAAGQLVKIAVSEPYRSRH
jgi:predicted Zn-dependent protease